MTCDNSFQAHIVQGALLNEGITSVLHNEMTSNVFGAFCRTIAGVEVFVYEKDYERALRVVNGH